MGTDMDILDRARAYLNCDTTLDGLGVTNLVAAMHDEIAHLRARLELDESGVDGIQCRDATIKVQDAEIERLRAELAASQAREAEFRRFIAERPEDDDSPWVYDCYQCSVCGGYIGEDGSMHHNDGCELVRLREMPADDTALKEREAALMARLAASQAREAKLREVITRIQNRCSGEAMPRWENTPATGKSRSWILDHTNVALALPTDDSALRERLAKERERCLACYSPDDTADDWADKIRALGDEA